LLLRVHLTGPEHEGATWVLTLLAVTAAVFGIVFGDVSSRVAFGLDLGASSVKQSVVAATEPTESYDQLIRRMVIFR
jgi:hypothetical protein